MVEIEVLKGRDDSYPIYVGPGILAKIGDLCQRSGLGKRVLVITNDSVGPLYLSAVIASLEQAGFSVAHTVVPEGEAQKSWQVAGKLLDECVRAGLERTSFIVALGGGVIGDLAGFVASIYMRGIRFVQAPTTLLSQVDAAVGGKVAVNHPAGKNLVGSFHQPSLVVSDISTLSTLPDRELSAGMAEVVKHGLIRDPDLYAFVSKAPELFLQRDVQALERAIVDSCQIKSAVVLNDEKEHGERAILNFGHTAGHAIEAAAGYGTYTHGEAVAIGMVVEALLSTQTGAVTQVDVERLIGLLHSLKLPTQPAPDVAERAADYLMRDKKVQEGKLRMALLHKIGQAYVTDRFNADDVRRVMLRVAQGHFVG